MNSHDEINLRQAADVLSVEPVRLFRLGRHFRLAPGDPCLPAPVISRALDETDEESRYRVILGWLVEHSGSSPFVLVGSAE